MKSVLQKIVFGVFSVFAAALSTAEAGEMVDKIVVTVNQEVITQYDVDRVIGTIKKDPSKTPKEKTPGTSDQDLRKAALNHLIDETLINQEMEKMAIPVSDEDVNQAVQSVLQRNNMTLENLKKELNSQGTSYESYRADLKKQIKRIRYIGQVVGNKVRVTDEEVQAFYEQNADKIKGVQGEVHIAQIVVPLSPAASDAELKAAGRRADEIYKKAKGGANFDSLMKEAGGEGSGDLGKVSFSSIAPQVANALQALEEGQVSEPIRTQMGFLVVKLYDKPEGTLKASDQVKAGLKDRIYEIKVQQELQKYVDQLKTKAFIDIKS